MGTIQEYVGDGHGGVKPWPALIPRPADSVTDQISRMGYPLHYGDPPATQFVRKRQISWYRSWTLTTVGQPHTVVITLQPTADEDTDLFVLEASGGDYYDGADVLGFSDRTPDGTAPDPAVPAGYAPDWVAFTTGATGGFPAAQVAVYGFDTTVTRSHFQIEADLARKLTVNGAARSGGSPTNDSAWYWFSATSGTQYTVNMTDKSGDPDLFVYGATSSDFIDLDDGTTNASISFTATATGRHYVRVAAYDADTHDVAVTSP